MTLPKQKSELEQLATLASNLHARLEDMNRPLVIEFAGTPKAGKTTCVNAIAKFFRRNEIPVHVVTERASLSPISNKHHLFFNAWTGVSSLAQLLEALERKSKIIIIDRGLFDALVWIDFLQTWHAVTPEEVIKLENFFLLEPWTSRIDIVVALSVDPTVAVEREFKDQITDLPGSIMNPDNLQGYNNSLERAMVKYHDKYHLLHIDTSDREAVDGVKVIANQLLNAAYRLVDEDIAVVDRSYVSQGKFDNSTITRAEDLDKFLSGITENIQWKKRTEAENDLSLVQIIPVATIQRNHEILVLNIRGEKHGRLANHNSVWSGGHIRISDSEIADRFFTGNIFHSCLYRELDEELQIRIRLNDLRQLPQFIVWDTTTPKSAQHLGLFYEYKIPDKTPREVLHLREFYETKTKSLFTQFQTIDENMARISDWENWSALYLRKVHNINIPLLSKQGKLF